jgi:hypothetical protein
MDMTRKHAFCARRAACSLIALGCGIVAACSNEGPASLAPAAEAQKTPPAAPAAKGPAKSLPKGAFQVKLAEIPDPTGFGGVAARVLVPIGWRTEGGVVWAPNLNCAADPASFGWSAVSPDGASRIELFPGEMWMASNSLQTQCMYADFQNVESYLTAYVQRRYPGARRIEYRSRIDFLDLNKDYLQASIALINNSGTGIKAWADAGELVYSHTENGVEMRGVVSASAMFYAAQAWDSFNNRPLMTLTGAVMSTFAARGPAAGFDPKMAEMIRKSVKPDYAWAQKYIDHKLKIGGANVENTRKTAAIIVANGAAMTAATIAANQAATKGYADRVATAERQADRNASTAETDDRIQRERIESIRGVETYNDPLYGGTVQLDNTYDHAWRVQNADSYILTNDPNFNPGLYNIDAQQLKPVP